MTTKVQPVQLLHIFNGISQKTRSEDHQQYSEHLKESSQVEFRTQFVDGKRHAQRHGQSEGGPN